MPLIDIGVNDTNRSDDLNSLHLPSDFFYMYVYIFKIIIVRVQLVDVLGWCLVADLNRKLNFEWGIIQKIAYFQQIFAGHTITMTMDISQRPGVSVRQLVHRK